ncbi:unnamed protein product [Rotaria sordida]|uniref:Uncharacterized protein n=1 Tax=Rotaria sordida TaxID=392033 RepID=A0A815MVT6_9BILA|nr:unnamed protein product [Rotaria sordida]CAF1632428.1 unnamed protein product [Rotaria sordida]
MSNARNQAFQSSEQDSTPRPWKTHANIGLSFWNNISHVTLIVLCVIGIIFALLALIFGKKFKKIKRSTITDTIITTKEKPVVIDVSPDTKYEPVSTI